jgi:hypothetical protein
MDYKGKTSSKPSPNDGTSLPTKGCFDKFNLELDAWSVGLTSLPPKAKQRLA